MPSSQMTKRWDRWSMEMEITKKKIGEGVHYKNVFGLTTDLSLVMPI